MKQYSKEQLYRDIQRLGPLSDLFVEYKLPDANEVKPEKLNHRYPQSVLQEGFTPIPNSLLNNYKSLNMTSNEALFVIHLMFYKRDKRNPYPSISKIASKMGITDHQARSYARSLESKGLLSRIGRNGKSNEFDLNLLFERLGDSNEEE